MKRIVCLLLAACFPLSGFATATHQPKPGKPPTVSDVAKQYKKQQRQLKKQAAKRQKQNRHAYKQKNARKRHHAAA